MAISDSDKVDFLWKKDIYGVSKTAGSTIKFGSNETIPSKSAILPSQLWYESDQISGTPPVATNSVIKVYKGATAIKLTNDSTSPVNQTWLMTSTFGDATTRMTDFISFNFGASYAAVVYIGNPNGGPAARIFPDTTGEEFVIDYAAGVLYFDGTIPANKTATVGSGTVSVATNGVYVEIYQYIGSRFPSIASSLDALTDVDFSTASPSNGDVLTYDGVTGTWHATTLVAPPQELSELTDVDFHTTAPADKDVLTYDGTSGTWQPGPPPASDSEHILLGTNTGDGNWNDGALPLDATKSVGYAIDGLNGILGLLVPAQPPAFPNGTALTVANSAGSTPLLAGGGVADNTGTSTITAGTAVTRITATTVNSNLFNDMGPGKTGTVTSLINGVAAGTHTLTGTSDNGTYTSLVIGDQKDYPTATPGFWKSIDISIAAGATTQGVNKMQITHTGAGNTGETYFVRDNLSSTPALSSTSVVQANAGTVAYSSSIPHYNTGATLTVAASVSNLAGETYYGGTDPLVISGTNGIITNKTYTYANLGITTPINRQTVAATPVTSQTFSVDGTNVHNSGTIQGVAKNVNGASAAANMATTVILVKNGSASGRIDENSITVTGLGSSPNANNAVRVAYASGGDKPTGNSTAWDSTAALPTYEATVVGGVMKNDQTNYSTGFLPAGPDLSTGRNGAQYATYKFQRSALSAFKLAITGTYAGVWIKLPGISDAQPNGGGWWDMFQSYTGAGIPGSGADTNAGCALGTVMNGASGTFQGTFGTASSTNSTSNAIEVRVRLNAGQSVTALSFTN